MSITIGPLGIKDRAGCQIAKRTINAACLHKVIISNKVQENKTPKLKQNTKESQIKKQIEEKSARYEAHRAIL